MLGHVFVVFACFLFAFLGIRTICFAIVHYLMNSSAYKKRKKGMTFKERFIMSRFRLEIPRFHIIVYYSTIVIYSFFLIAAILLYYMTEDGSSYKFLKGIITFTVFGITIYGWIFMGFNWMVKNKPDPDKIKYRGVNKKEYMERRRKFNQDKKKTGDDTDF